ncbi:HRH3 [Branchiostoma lanceolatum]|uniref:HRH3 protein n=1 Tax=Branchiostoma lanceolatum TaxID=7740 RepID=A0A8K0A7Y8_BRALA|nr:HRH3 [Branchiostoma lanceolatum]
MTSASYEEMLASQLSNVTSSMAATESALDYFVSLAATCMPTNTTNVTTDHNITVMTPPPFSNAVAAVLALLITVVILVTVFGNLLVIVAFWRTKTLQTTSNYFLMNLAVADLMIGLLAMPPYAPYILTGNWPLGHSMCVSWLALDYCFCSASTLNIMAISLDRYRCVTQAVKYKLHNSKNTTYIQMALVWIIAFLLYGPAIVSWEHVAGKRLIPDRKCFVPFHDNFPFTFTASVVEFFTPFVSVSFFYFKVYKEIRERAKAKLKRKDEYKALRTSFRRRDGSRGSSNLDIPSSLAPEMTTLTVFGSSSSSTGASNRPLRAKKKLSFDHMGRELRVAKTLAIVVVVFAICWTPFTIFTLIRTLCSSCIVDELYEVSFWFLWLNSTINPIVYAAFHTQFRAAFQSLICQWCKITFLAEKEPVKTEQSYKPGVSVVREERTEFRTGDQT